jgi:hypothetical protein
MKSIKLQIKEIFKPINIFIKIFILIFSFNSNCGIITNIDIITTPIKRKVTINELKNITIEFYKYDSLSITFKENFKKNIPKVITII